MEKGLEEEFDEPKLFGEAMDKQILHDIKGHQEEPLSNQQLYGDFRKSFYLWSSK